MVNIQWLSPLAAAGISASSYAYRHAWEQRQLGEVVSERNERSASGELLSISMSRGVYPTSCSDRKDNSSEDKSNYKHLAVGDIAYNSMRMWQGACGLSSFDGIISPAYTVVIPSAATDGRFLIDLFKTTEMLNTFQRNSQGLTSDTWNLKYPAFSKIKCSIPSLHEQRLIGQFFSTLDSLIAAAERQEALLKQKKQAYLQLMFPQEGETEPRLRFAGFSGEWETRQLGEVAEVHNGRDYKHLQPGNIPVYGTSGYMLSVDDALSWNDDAVGIGRKGTIDKPCILRAPFWTVDTLFFVTPRPSTPLEFLFALFESVNWKSKDESTGVPSLTKQAIVNTAVKVPDTSEQHQIGVFFTQIDNIIAIAEEQAKALRAMKRAYSQRMFI